MGADDAARPVLAIRLGPALRSCDAAAALRFAEAARRPLVTEPKPHAGICQVIAGDRLVVMLLVCLCGTAGSLQL